MTRSLLAAMLLWGALNAARGAAPPSVCIEDRVDLSVVAKLVMQSEARRWIGGRMEFRDGPCRASGGDSITITLQSAPPPGSPAGVLGRARLRDGRVEPALEVFVEPVKALVGANDFEVLGRALGRVAAHEAAHYLLQRAEHTEHGLFRETLTAAHLTAAGRPLFRIARRKSSAER